MGRLNLKQILRDGFHIGYYCTGNGILDKKLYHKILTRYEKYLKKHDFQPNKKELNKIIESTKG